jgi:protein-L-isoaspartate(D-aspartate) O-methyltransferase
MMGTQGSGMTSQRTRNRMIERLRLQGIRDEVVLAAMAATPRHVFIDEALADTALPLGFGQTISQPYIVAKMIELLRSGRNDLGKTLEIGAGCGYQASVLGRLTKEVFAVERLKPLLEKAKLNLRQTQQFNIRLKYADGHEGLPEAAPFDTIICAAAATHVPPALLQQLALGGRMVLPLGTTNQVMLLVERTPNGFTETRYEAVRFVPMLLGTE